MEQFWLKWLLIIYATIIFLFSNSLCMKQSGSAGLSLMVAIVLSSLSATIVALAYVVLNAFLGG